MATNQSPLALFSPSLRRSVFLFFSFFLLPFIPGIGCYGFVFACLISFSLVSFCFYVVFVTCFFSLLYVRFHCLVLFLVAALFSLLSLSGLMLFFSFCFRYFCFSFPPPPFFSVAFTGDDCVPQKRASVAGVGDDRGQGERTGGVSFVYRRFLFFLFLRRTIVVNRDRILLVKTGKYVRRLWGLSTLGPIYLYGPL